ncbi:four helix bundle protein [Flavobacterium cyanobacteriorum]|uniref:four helix bundle protein n=1 Tax=Flavobacterium cyanobacteriorum TaxID=2022802 RepID=UPI0013FDEB3A|nr:four helix bundle protein [Flavobacterium cyanobacteriorum]
MKQQLLHRTKKIAHDCVKLSLQLPNNYLSNHTKGQLIRCSTSVAANYRASCIAQTKKSFVSKLSIVIEEIDEAAFWLEFLIDENILPRELCLPFHKEASELTAIFVSSRKTASKALNAVSAENKNKSINNE